MAFRRSETNKNIWKRKMLQIGDSETVKARIWNVSELIVFIVKLLVITNHRALLHDFKWGLSTL